jgi:beta-glucosidase
MKIFFMLRVLALLPAHSIATEFCSKQENQQFPFCNTSLLVPDRATDLVGRMTQEQKIAQMVNGAPPIDALGIKGYNWWTEALHGVLGSCTHDKRCPTSYPMPIGLGATFNMSLIKTMASQISSEARRMNAENEEQQQLNDKWRLVGLDFWAPNINIFRDPRWGRGMYSSSVLKKRTGLASWQLTHSFIPHSKI